MSGRITPLLGLVALALAGTVATPRRAAFAIRSCDDYCVSVTPDGATRQQDAGSTDTLTFTVSNTGLDDTYHLTCYGPGIVDCSFNTDAFLPISSFDQAEVTVTYTVASQNATLRLKAIGEARDSGSLAVTVQPIVTVTAPLVTSDTTALVYSKFPLLQAHLYPVDAYQDTTTLVVVVGSDTVTNFTRRNRGLVEWQLDSTRMLSSGVLKKVTVRVCMTNSVCRTAKEYLKLDDSGKPWLSFDGMPFEAQGRVFGAPFGPGFSVSGADVEAGFSVPGYVSMGIPRSTGLVYSTRQSFPRALVNADIELPWPGHVPDSVKAVLVEGTV